MIFSQESAYSCYASSYAGALLAWTSLSRAVVAPTLHSIFLILHARNDLGSLCSHWPTTPRLEPPAPEGIDG